MSKTVPGTFVRVSANRVTAVFIIDVFQRTYNATVSPSLQLFTPNNATLYHNTEDQLTSTRSNSGRVGTDTFKLDLDNGVTIDGKFNVPGISPASTVNGSDAWEEN